jgi:hypothetical protein
MKKQQTNWLKKSFPKSKRSSNKKRQTVFKLSALIRFNALFWYVGHDNKLAECKSLHVPS